MAHIEALKETIRKSLAASSEREKAIKANPALKQPRGDHEDAEDIELWGHGVEANKAMEELTGLIGREEAQKVWLGRE
jgi:hypothetical protein